MVQALQVVEQLNLRTWKQVRYTTDFKNEEQQSWGLKTDGLKDKKPKSRKRGSPHASH